jgi:L-fuconolactonase
MTPTIDAHQHFWKLDLPFDFRWLDKPDLAPIRRDYLPEDLAPQLKAAGVRRSIFVQTQHNLDETRWALGLADQHDFITGVVGWVDLASKKCEEQLLEFKDNPKFVGVRHITQDEADDDFIISSDVIRGLKVLERHKVPFDLLFYVKHLPHAATLARRLPELPMVIDHLAKPRIKEKHLAGWVEPLRAAAHHENLYCKLAGLVTEAAWGQWTADDLKPFVHAALDAFGPERCMYGSDWPVCELAGTYGEVHDALVDALGPITASERTQIFGGTAARFYGLS